LSVNRIVFEIFDFQNLHDLETGVRGQSRLLRASLLFTQISALRTFLFPKWKKLYFSRELSYVDDVWFDDRISLYEVKFYASVALPMALYKYVYDMK